jgi:multidrug efflux system outer membrane protein
MKILKTPGISMTSCRGRRFPESLFPASLFPASIICALLLLVSSTALAQTPATPEPAMPKIGFDEAVRRAIEKSPTVAQAATAIGRAEALLQQARALTLPSVAASITNVTIDSPRGFDGAVAQPRDQATFGADLSVPVLAPARWAAVNQSRDQIDVANRSVADVRQQIGVATAGTYLAIIAGHRQVEVETRALESARAHLDYAQKRLAGGVGSRLNELRAAQVVSSEQARLETTRVALRRSQEALGVLLAENSPIDVDGEPAFDVSIPADESQWLTQRTDVQLQSSITRAAERVLRDSWRDWLPNASATFSPQLVTPAGLLQPSRTWRLTVGFSQPIYEGGARRAAEALRRLSLEQSRLATTDIEIRARSEVRVAQAAVDSLSRALESARLAATQAAEVLRITATAFEVGATTNIEVIDAQRSARDAETVASQAEDAVRRAQLDLLVAIGRFPR